MNGCKICMNALHHSPDEVVVCSHKDGMVHMGCCNHRCSMDGQMCPHGVAVYKKA